MSKLYCILSCPYRAHPCTDRQQPETCAKKLIAAWIAKAMTGEQNGCEPLELRPNPHDPQGCIAKAPGAKLCSCAKGKVLRSGSPLLTYWRLSVTGYSAAVQRHARLLHVIVTPRWGMPRCSATTHPCTPACETLQKSKCSNPACQLMMRSAGSARGEARVPNDPGKLDSIALLKKDQKEPNPFSCPCGRAAAFS